MLSESATYKNENKHGGMHNRGLNNYSEQPEALAAEGVRESKAGDGSLPFAKQTFNCRLP